MALLGPAASANTEAEIESFIRDNLCVNDISSNLSHLQFQQRKH